MKRASASLLIVVISVGTPVVCLAQGLTGTVVAIETGAPITRATVVAIQKTAVAGQRAVN